MATFQPATTLRSRTFIGLLIAQFLAAFNDQAIHASAMFFAIRHRTMTEADAISLMPILFYAPWALFATVAGWLADHYSKRNTLIAWKIAEVVITLLALLGFYLGATGQFGPLGPWLVLSTVFLMGTHSAFFVPAKYGCMPEILAPHLLSRGNGLLESLSFLAVILGTVCGGVLSSVFRGEEWKIGLVLVTLAVVGAVASFLIRKMPAANPSRRFPVNPFKPIWDNLKVMLRSKPVALAMLGIAFFTFVVAYMRGVMYMHGETRNPRWDELWTSAVVGTVALGIGLGSPLAGFFSGGKIELGLVPLGAVGMILALLTAAFTLNSEVALVACLVLVGFFTGFYIVPLFTLFQHRAPRQSKGDLLATSNVINVLGAIVASLLFRGLVLAAAAAGVTPPTEKPHEVARGVLAEEVRNDEHGRPALFKVQVGDDVKEWGAPEAKVEDEPEPVRVRVVGRPEPGRPVVVGEYQMVSEGKPVTVYVVQPANWPLEPDYDREPLTRYLFLGAALMTTATLLTLWWRLPDLFLRSLLWRRSLGRKVTVLGVNHLPTEGPVLLATNADNLDAMLQVLAAVDRYPRFLLPEGKGGEPVSGLVRSLARRHGLGVLRVGAPEGADWKQIEQGADRALGRGLVVGLPLDGGDSAHRLEDLIEQLGARRAAPVAPVYCEVLPAPEGSGKRNVYVVFGPPLAPGTPGQAVRSEIQRLGDELKEQLRKGVDLTRTEAGGH